MSFSLIMSDNRLTIVTRSRYLNKARYTIKRDVILCHFRLALAHLQARHQEVQPPIPGGLYYTWSPYFIIIGKWDQIVIS